MDTLEENGGDDGNSSVAELEVRVTTLETTVSGQDARLRATESGLEGILFKLVSQKYFALEALQLYIYKH